MLLIRKGYPFFFHLKVVKKNVVVIFTVVLGGASALIGTTTFVTNTKVCHIIHLNFITNYMHKINIFRLDVILIFITLILEGKSQSQIPYCTNNKT